MSVGPSVRCDVCGAEKKETNHWWGAILSAAGQLAIRPWSKLDSPLDATHHLCGQGCALKLAERYLEGQLQGEE